MLISPFEFVVGFASFIEGGNHRPGFGERKYFPMTAVEHVTVVLKTELALGRPLRFAESVEMPLTGVAGFVALAAEHLGKGHDVVAERDVVIRDRRGLRIPTADERRPRRRTNRGGGVEARGDRAVLCDPVDVRRADDLAAVTAERFEMMLIRLDDEDVVRLGRRERLAKRSQEYNYQ